MTIIQELARNILETSFESLDKETIEHAKSRISDVIGCLIGGANAPGCKIMVDLVKEWGGKEESTILVHGGKAPAHNVAMVNSIMCRSFDFEPVEVYAGGMNIPAHVSGTTVPTAIAMAEKKMASGKDLITALILGDDLTSRILAASGFSFDSGWDSTGTVNMFGSTAIAGRLLRLDEPQMLNAFGIVLNQMAGSFQNIYDGTHCFKLPMGLAARAGIFSADLASKGFTGIKDPLFSKHGYFSLYCRNPTPEILTRDLGKRFYAERTLKPYPACRSTHAAIDCALSLNTHNIEPSNIREIVVNVTTITSDMFVSQPFTIGDVPQVNAAFNLRYAVANALLRKSVRLEHFTEEFIRDSNVFKLIQKVRIKATMPPEKPLATGMEIIMQDGTKFSAYVDVPRGDIIHNPLTREDIKEKFRNNLTFSQTVPIENAEKALHMLETLEEVNNVAEIVREIQAPRQMQEVGS